jgi:hypothetical protein
MTTEAKEINISVFSLVTFLFPIFQEYFKSGLLENFQYAIYYIIT